MANMCSNWVTIEGDEKQIKQFVELVGEEFDFEKVIPTDTDTKDEADEKWGCNSIAFDTVFDGNDELWASWNFWTKWNPPTLIYEKLCEMFPKLFIYWRYEERGCELYGYLNNGDY